MKRQPTLLVAIVSVILGVAALVVLAACATPEATLKHGYELVSGFAKTNTVLLQRHVITADEAETNLLLGDTAKKSLDDGKAKLKECRAKQVDDPALKCDSAVAQIDLGSGVLLQLEQYLEKRQGEVK